MKMRARPRRPSQAADQGWAVMSTLIAGFAVWGAIGWLLDQWWGTRLATPIGLLVGMALGIYAVVARHGRPAPVDRTVGSSYISTASSTPRTAVAAPAGEGQFGRTAGPTEPRGGTAAGSFPRSGIRRETA